MGGPLLAGVTVVALSSLAPLALPLGMRGLAISESISLYGGLAVFGGFVLYEFVPSFLFSREVELTLCPFLSTQKILHNARLAETGAIRRDPIRESIGLELDIINILYVPRFRLCFFMFSPRRQLAYALFNFSQTKARKSSRIGYRCIGSLDG